MALVSVVDAEWLDLAEGMEAGDEGKERNLDNFQVWSQSHWADECDIYRD